MIRDFDGTPIKFFDGDDVDETLKYKGVLKHEPGKIYEYDDGRVTWLEYSSRVFNMIAPFVEDRISLVRAYLTTLDTDIARIYLKAIDKEKPDAT